MHTVIILSVLKAIHFNLYVLLLLLGLLLYYYSSIGVYALSLTPSFTHSFIHCNTIILTDFSCFGVSLSISYCF